jgi:hypothetical protein
MTEGYDTPPERDIDREQEIKEERSLERAEMKKEREYEAKNAKEFLVLSLVEALIK